MKQKQSWFQLYPESNRASNLSIAGGAVRLLSLLLLIAAIGATLVLLLAGARCWCAATPPACFRARPSCWPGPGRPPRSPPQTRPRRNDSTKEPKAGRGFPSRPSALIYLPYTDIIKAAGRRLPAHLFWCCERRS